MIPISKTTMGKEEVEAVNRILKRRFFTRGPEVEEFEKEFAKYLGVKYAIATNSGTSALHVASLCSGLKGMEFITVPNTFIATSDMAMQAGGIPVFVDVEEKTYNIDVSKIEETITEKTKALIVVHLYGHPCDMDPIVEICEKHGLFLIEDCAQSHGATYKGKKTGTKGKKTGTFGDVACFSFYPTKTMGVGGEGGMIVTNNEEIAKKARMFVNSGRGEIKDRYEVLGYNYRMNEIQAAFGRVQLKKLDALNKRRREIAAFYAKNLDPKVVTTPVEEPYAKRIYTYYVVRSKNRDRLQKYLENEGIQSAVHYPIPIHLQSVYLKNGFKEGDFPVTERIVKEILTIPFFPDLTKEQLKYICETVNSFS